MDLFAQTLYIDTVGSRWRSPLWKPCAVRVALILRKYSVYKPKFHVSKVSYRLRSSSSTGFLLPSPSKWAIVRPDITTSEIAEGVIPYTSMILLFLLHKFYFTLFEEEILLLFGN
ncbi:unnamed protein product [Citrullus colocynthis]|uniref:Uncharacterized protein n=1 Tax=Citrullus colocynthis TaxID=252529 RepID=A0ABP0YEG3_9ROSI